MAGVDAADLLDFGTVEMVDLEFRYELTLPYTVVVRRVSADKLARITYFAVQPVSDTACRGYVVLRVPPAEAGGKDWDEYAAGLIEIQDVVQEQDRRVVESQRPEQLPEDLSAELHFRFDRLAVRYRQGLSRLGIT
jgi:Vanillate O-demethylase oxygenase C-terminal domain